MYPFSYNHSRKGGKRPLPFFKAKLGSEGRQFKPARPDQPFSSFLEHLVLIWGPEFRAPGQPFLLPGGSHNVMR
jgi:hypothetical protein